MVYYSKVIGLIRLENLNGVKSNEEETKGMRSKVKEYFDHCFNKGVFELSLDEEWVDRFDKDPDDTDKTVGNSGFFAEVRYTFINNLRWLMEIGNIPKLKELDLDNFRITFKFDEYDSDYKSFLKIGDKGVFEVKDGIPSLVISSEEKCNDVKTVYFNYLCGLNLVQLCDLLRESKSLFDAEEIYYVVVDLLTGSELRLKIANLYKYIGKYLIKEIDVNTNLTEDRAIQRILKISRRDLIFLEEALEELKKRNK